MHYSTILYVDIDQIDKALRPASQMREHLNDEAIDTYAASIDKMPPVRLAVDAEGVHWVIDGAHTITAAKAAHKTSVRAVITNADYLSAFRQAARCNVEHGVRVTNADKRHRVEVALKIPAMNSCSQRDIADLCAVTQRMVSTYRSVKNGSKPATIGKDGKKYGPRKPRKPKPTPQSEDSEPDPESNGEPTHKQEEPTEPESFDYQMWWAFFVDRFWTEVRKLPPDQVARFSSDFRILCTSLQHELPGYAAPKRISL